MREDLHNDMDDLFRSRLEGKEDTPSPDVWAAIARGLPSPPASTAPSATGGVSKTLLFKGLSGLVIIALVGTGAYFRVSGEQEKISIRRSTARTATITTSPETESGAIPTERNITAGNPAVESAGYASSDKNTPTDSPTAEKSAAADSDTRTTAPTPLAATAADAETIPTQKVSPESTPFTQAQDIRAIGRNLPVTIQKNDPVPPYNPHTDRQAMSENSGLSTARNERLRPETMPSPLNIGADPNHPETSASSTAPGSAATRNKEKVVTIPSKTLTATPAQHAIHFLSVPIFGDLHPANIASQTSPEKALGRSQKGSASLRRNDWNSKLYVVPTVSMNITRMDVQENKRFGGRLGRELIEYRETEDTRMSFSPGIITGFSLTPRIAIQTGFSELRNEISISPKQIRAVRDRDGEIRYRFDCSAGTYFINPKPGAVPQVGDSLRIASSDIQMRYASIPIAIRVNFGKQHVRVFATAGSDINLLVRKNSSTSFSPASNEKISPVRSEGTRMSYLNGTIGAGVDLMLGKRWGVMLTPQYRFPLGIINDEGPVRTYPKTFSVIAGLRIGF